MDNGNGKFAAWEAATEEERLFLEGIASVLREFIDGGAKNAADYLAAQILEESEMLALWHILPAHVRTAIKRAQN